jgi:hypothetical protein
MLGLKKKKLNGWSKDLAHIDIESTASKKPKSNFKVCVSTHASKNWAHRPQPVLVVGVYSNMPTATVHTKKRNMIIS